MKKSMLWSAALVLLAGALWAGGATEPAAAAQEGRYGGVVTKAFFAPTNLDPAFLASITDDEIARFWGISWSTSTRASAPTPAAASLRAGLPAPTGSHGLSSCAKGSRSTTARS